MTAAKKLSPAVTQPTVAIDSIRPSPTNPRKNFDPAALKELAASITAVGVLQPVVLRPLAGHKGATYELVAGERRWRASKLAGLKEIPATVRELDDVQVREVQLIENCKRVDLHPLEEADAYNELEALGKTVEEIAEGIGKKVGYVYGRKKLSALKSTAAREAFAAGRIGSELALLIARIPDAKKQDDAAEQLLRGDYEGKGYPWSSSNSKKPENWRPVTLRKAREVVQKYFMLKLAGAPFKRDDPELVPKMGACGTCPNNTKNQPAVFADVPVEMCTLPSCFSQKCAKTKANEKAKLKEKGVKLLAESTAKQVFDRYTYGGDSDVRKDSGYLDLKAKPAGARKTWKELLGDKAEDAVVVARDHKGKLRELVDVDVAAKAVKELELKVEVPKKPKKEESRGREYDYAAAEKRREEKQDAYERGAFAALGKVVAKVEQAPAGVEYFREIATAMMNGDYGHTVQRRFGKKGNHKMLETAIASGDEAWLRGLVWELSVGYELADEYQAHQLAKVCKRHGVDPEATEEPAQAPPPKPVKGKKTVPVAESGMVLSETPKPEAKPAVAGTCRVCGCTWEHGCPEGCWWVDKEETLCSSCDLKAKTPTADPGINSTTGKKRRMKIREG